MRGLANYRYNVARTFARMLGQPVMRKRLVSQVKMGASHTELTQLQAGIVAPLQVLDTGDPNYGKFYYDEDYDSPDDPNHPIR